MTLAPPVRKKLKGDHQAGDPLPIPIASLTGFPTSATSWNYYSGVYKDGVVLVTDLNQVASLWHNGYFGQLKNTNLQKEDFSGEEPYKFQKTWTLIETDGIKDVSFFKKTIELEEEEYVPESLPCSVDSDCEVVNTVEGSEDENPQAEKSESEKSGGNKDENIRLEMCAKVCKEKHNDEIQEIEPSTRKNYTETSCILNDNTDRETNQNCKTVLTFDSDQISSIFFEDFNVDTSSGHMELLLEEAMFLSYALGCLVVKKQNTQPEAFKYFGGKAPHEQDWTIDQMWKEFVDLDPKFVARYAVYHHYRTKGWVVKSGLKFGADFVLYPVGPPFYHAQFTVMIQSVWSDNNERDESLSSREMSWTSVAATARLNNHVKKMPLICYVLRPRSLTSKSLSNIICLKSLTVKEVLLSRWDPTAANEPEQDMIFLE